MRSQWVFIAMLFLGGSERAAAQVVSNGHPNVDSCSVVAQFAQTYTRNYRNGEPYDFVTIAPDGRGETFAGTGISITVILRYATGTPAAGIPREAIQIYNPNLCICPGGSIADAPTDITGTTTFSGTIAGGGCAEMHSIYVEGLFIGTIPVKINSTDAVSASPCFTDGADLSALAARLGRPEAWSICFDYNESGPPTIDAGDLAFFASTLGAACR